jgi:hypothetical protein
MNAGSPLNSALAIDGRNKLMVRLEILKIIDKSVCAPREKGSKKRMIENI